MNDDTPLDPSPSRSELQLEERAIRQRWPVSDQNRTKILQRLCSVVDPANGGGDRKAIAAARVLIAADRLNLDGERLAHATKRPEEAADRAAQTVFYIPENGRDGTGSGDSPAGPAQLGAPGEVPVEPG